MATSIHSTYQPRSTSAGVVNLLCTGLAKVITPVLIRLAK
jgi:hypothetical protein